MNFFNDRALARKFLNNQVSEKEKLIYLLINLTLYYLSFYLPNDDEDINILILDIAILIVGVIFCYKLNAKGDNRNYVERYLSLSVPIGVQSLIVFLILTIILNIIEQFLSIKFKGNLEIIINTIIPNCYFFWRLYGSIKIASGQ